MGLYCSQHWTTASPVVPGFSAPAVLCTGLPWSLPRRLEHPEQWKSQGAHRLYQLYVQKKGSKRKKLSGMEKRGEKKQIRKKKRKQEKNLEMPGIEPGASHMRSERSTTELHPQGGRQKLPKCAIYPLWLQTLTRIGLPTPELAPITSMAILGQCAVSPNMVVFMYFWCPARSMKVISLEDASHISSALTQLE